MSRTSLSNLRGLRLNEFGVELWKTYLLLFGRDEHSMRIAVSMGVDMSVLRAFRYDIFPSNIPLQLEDFQFFQGRLRLIQQKMDDWRPQRVRELWKRGYRDPLTYYTFVTAIFFGVLGIVGLVASIIQAWASYVQVQ